MAAFTPVLSPNLPVLGTGCGPDERVLVASSAYTATASQEFVVLVAEAVEIVVDYTKTGSAPSVVYTLEAFDVAKGNWITLLTSAATTATGTVFLLVGPYVPNVTNVSAAHPIRNRMRVTATHGNTDVATYSISATSS